MSRLELAYALLLLWLPIMTAVSGFLFLYLHDLDENPRN